METYTINGVQVEYDTFSISAMELYTSEFQRVLNFIKNELADSDGYDKLHEYVDNVRDFFDTVIGEGTSDKLFGNSDNIREFRNALIEFRVAVDKNMEVYKHEYDDLTAPNREQRRAADRQKRRAESAKRAALKSGET